MNLITKIGRCAPLLLIPLLACAEGEGDASSGAASDSLAAARQDVGVTALAPLPAPPQGFVAVVIDPRVAEGARARIARVVSQAEEQAPADTMYFASLKDSRFNLILAVDEQEKPIYLASVSPGGASYLGVSSTVRALVLSLLRQRASAEVWEDRVLLERESWVHQLSTFELLVDLAGRVDARGERILENKDIAKGAGVLLQQLVDPARTGP